MAMSNYHKQQETMCKALGIKPPPKGLSLIQKFRYVYKKLVNKK